MCDRATYCPKVDFLVTQPIEMIVEDFSGEQTVAKLKVYGWMIENLYAVLVAGGDGEKHAQLTNPASLWNVEKAYKKFLMTGE